MSDVAGCLACDLVSGRRELPGGVVSATANRRVEHCVGPLGVGTLVVKPTRHVVHLADLEPAEAAELGPLLQRSADVYVCLWSHAGGVPVHIHFVVQPVSRAAIDERGFFGPVLQVAMFNADVEPPRPEVEQFCERARAELDR